MSRLDALAARVLHDFRRRDGLTCYAHHSNQHADEIRMQETFRDLVAPDLDKEVERLREANQRLRNGYADAQAGLRYVRQYYGNLSGVGFDRVFDHYHEWVTMPEREGLLAGSHEIAALKEGRD